ncbi:MAG TPA: hypothetical protein VN832_11095 [Stellaceae bacterium]|nr:hypothetical protein [Stellaceae bacterium]
MKINYLIVFICALPGLAGGAQAQQAGQDVITDPAAIRVCLCRQETVAALSDRLQEQRRAYEERRAALAALDAQVQAQRKQLDPTQPSQLEAFKHLLDQRDEAELSFADEATPTYAAAVDRHNAEAAAYNRECAGKIYDQSALAAAQAQSFACPKP